MRLNTDCVRDCLITCEDVPMESRPSLSMFFDQSRLQQYSQEDIVYSMKQLYEAGFIDVKPINSLGGPSFDAIFLDITWNGHQFLNDIRSDTIWQKTKETVKSTLGTTSLQVMGTLASSFAAKALGL